MLISILSTVLLFFTDNGYSDCIGLFSSVPSPYIKKKFLFCDKTDSSSLDKFSRDIDKIPDAFERVLFGEGVPSDRLETDRLSLLDIFLFMLELY